ncbi:MAG: hypothetical protein LBS16_02670 [Prevotellaceae bacterium]|jgi:hypothetical protein|nr:hypothetical protein [Prevotellaceae bacterium]
MMIEDNNIFYEFYEKSPLGFHASGIKLPNINYYDLFLGKLSPYQDIKYKYYMGRANAVDVISTGKAYIYLLSKRVISLMHENDITGWKTYPVTLYGREQNIINGYSLLAITGRCGNIDWSRSDIVKKQLAPDVPFVDVLRGMYFDPETWDGSDFFGIEGQGYILVTQKVRNLFEKNKITNATFTNLKDYETLRSSIFPDDYPVNRELLSELKAIKI